MTRFLPFLILLAAIPVSAQEDPLTPSERSRLETRVGQARDSLTEAREAFDALRPGQNRSAATARVRELEMRIAAGREDLARDDERRRAAPPDEDASATETPRSGSENRATGETDEANAPGTADEDEPGALVPPADGRAAPAAESFFKNPLVLGGIALALALAGAGGWWLTQQRKAQRRDALRYSPSASRLPPTGAEQLDRARAGGHPSPFVTPEQLAASEARLKQQIDTLTNQLNRLWNETQARMDAPPPTPAVVQTAPPPDQSPAEAAAAAFAEWCRRATPMMSKVDFFANALAETVPGARVQAVYRDLNSQAEPVRFDASGGASPAEFWLVAVGGETLVFPQPLNAHQFRDLTRIFDGTAAPASLGRVVPARVRDEGATFALVAPGRVS